MAIGTVGAIIGASVIGAGASIISGNKSAKAQRQAAEKSAEVEKYMYDTTRKDYAPYREVGYGALGKMASMYGVGRVDASGKPIKGAPGASGFGFNAGDFTTSPGYEFRR